MKEFYDEFSPFYHLIFDDWNSSIQRHAKIIDQIIRDEWGSDHITLVDVSCGIGTQTIGLAQLGYAVDASDISPKAIKRAQSETEKRNLAVKYSVADMRQCYKHHQKQFDVLISCDNSVPHLLSDSEILVAFKEFYNCLKPEGGCIITLRDYENEKREGVQVKPYEIKVVDAVKYIIFQTWEFKGDIYQISMFLIRDYGKYEIKTNVFRSQYYAVSKSRIIELMKTAGFSSVKQVQSEYYQPIIIGTKKG